MRSARRKVNIFRQYSNAGLRRRRRLLRYGLVLGNVLVLVITSLLITSSSGGTSAVYQAMNKAEDATVANPLDELSSSGIAANVALMAKLPETGLVINEADTLSTGVASNSSIISEAVVKPQILSTESKTKEDIVEYVVKEGDTIDSLVEEFGVTSDSIKWSNDLRRSELVVGKKLLIPPVNGIVYTVSSGDTPESLANKYNTSQEAIVSFNDAEISGLVEGVRIVVPNGTIRPASPASSRPYYASFAFGNAAIYGYNGYVPGYCTYYVASRVSVPVNWGNANSWANGARRTPGWNVSKVPVPGAVAQTARMHYLGHVAVVEAVSEDGAMMKYSDMNGLSGFGRVGYSDWVPVTHFDWYLYR